MNKGIRVSLIILNIFLALTAIAGGIGLLTEMNAPPVDFLANSPFKSYIIPGLSLIILVGGTASLAAILLIRNRQKAFVASFLSACSVIIFETVEIIVIGSPEGIARNLQIFYFAIGFIIGVLALRSKRLDKQLSVSN